MASKTERTPKVAVNPAGIGELITLIEEKYKVKVAISGFRPSSLPTDLSFVVTVQHQPGCLLDPRGVRAATGVRWRALDSTDRLIYHALFDVYLQLDRQSNPAARDDDGPF